MFTPTVPKSVEFVRMRSKTDNKMILTDLRFRIRKEATEADLERVGEVRRKHYSGLEVPPPNSLQDGSLQPTSFLCAPFSEGEL